MKTNFLKVGQIVNTQGVRGEVRVYPLTDYKERFEEIDGFFIEENYDEKIYIDKVKYKNNLVILKLRGIDSLNDAERLKSKYILIKRSDSKELPEDTYLIADLIGLNVYSDENELIGTIKNVIQYSGNDLYEIENHKNPSKNILVPAVGEFIKKIDLDKGVFIKVIEGLIE